jgi:hypothetical protein
MSDVAATPQAGTTSAVPPAPPAPPAPAAGPTGNGALPGHGADDDGASQTRKVGLGVVLVLVVVGLAFLIAFFGVVRHWLALHTGVTHGGPDPFYNFWSGFGSDLGEATLITAVGVGVYTGVRKVNCHTKGCWRIGHHVLEGTPYILCRRHHPYVPTGGATHEHILEQHRMFKEAKEAFEARHEPTRS